MKKNRLNLGIFLCLIVILALLVYFVPQTSFGRGIILSQVRTSLAEQGYDLSYQDSFGNLWRRLELTQTSLTTQGATLNFDTVGLNYNLLKLFSGEKPIGIRLKGVDGDLFLQQLQARERASSNIFAKYIEDLSIEEISLNLQDLPYDLPEFNLSNLDLLAFEESNTQIRGDLSTTKGVAELDLKIVSTEPFKATLDIINADAVLAQHWTQRVKAGQLSGQILVDDGKVTGGLELTNSQLSMADINISNINGQFQLANSQLTGQAMGTAFDSLAQGDLLLDLDQQQWQSQITSTTNLSEASRWIFRKSPMVHHYLKLSGQAPIELNLSGWQDIEVTAKAIAPTGLTMMEEPLENVQTDIYFAQGRTDVTVNADYRQGRMDYVRIAKNQETLLKLEDMLFVDSELQKANLNADVVFASGENGLKRLDGPLTVDYSINANGQEESFKADIQTDLKEDNWNFDVALTDSYGNDAQSTVAISSSETTLDIQSQDLELSYLADLLPTIAVDDLVSEKIDITLSTGGLTFQERLELNTIESLSNLVFQTNQLKIVADDLKLSSNGQSMSTKSLNASLDLQNSISSVVVDGLTLPFDVFEGNLVSAELQTEANSFQLDVKTDNSLIDFVEAQEISANGRLNQAKELLIDELTLGGLSATGQIDLAKPLTIDSLNSLNKVVSDARGSLDYTLSQTPVVVEGISETPLQLAATGTFTIGEALQSQAVLDVSDINTFGLPETLQADLTWQQDGSLTIVDQSSGLSLNRKIVAVASNLGVLEGDEVADSVAVSEVLLDNTALELFDQTVTATGTVTLFPNSEPSIDAVLEIAEYQVIAKGSLDAMGLEFNLPAGTDVLNLGINSNLNSSQLVTSQDLLFQGTLNLSAKQVYINAPLGNGLSLDSQLNSEVSENEISISAQWLEQQDGNLDSVNVQLQQGGLGASTRITDLANLNNVIVNVSGQGEVDKLADLFSYNVSGTLDTLGKPLEVSVSPFKVLGEASFVGQVQGQALNTSLQGQTRVVDAEGTESAVVFGDLTTSILGQEQTLSGELYPKLALNTTFPYLGELLVSGSVDALTLSGQGVLDLNQFVGEFSTGSQLADVIIEPQAWQLNGDLASQKLNLQLGKSSGQFEWSEDSEQDTEQDFVWSLLATIDQTATWQNLPVQLAGNLQHSSDQSIEIFQGTLFANTIPISVEGNRDAVDLNSTTQLKDILALLKTKALIEEDFANILAPITEEVVQAQGTIDLVSNSFDVSGQLSTDFPLNFSVDSQSGLTLLRVDGSTDVLSLIDLNEQMPLVGALVGSSLTTASTLSLETEFQSSIIEISELTISLDDGALLATIPFDSQKQLQIDSTVGWLKAWAANYQSQSNQLQLQSILESVSPLFSDQESVQLVVDSHQQALKATIGSSDTSVAVTVSNFNSSDLGFDIQIPTARAQAWQTQTLFSEQTIVPPSILTYLTSSDLRVSGQYNQETQALGATLNNDFLNLNVSAETGFANGVDFSVDSSVGVLQTILESTDLTSSGINPQLLSIAKQYMSSANANEPMALTASYSFDGLYDIQASIGQLGLESTRFNISKIDAETISFEATAPALILSQPTVQSLMPATLQRVASQAKLSDNLTFRGNYYITTKSYDLDVLFKHSTSENTVLKLQSDASNQLAIQLDAPASIASGVLTQSVQLPSSLTNVITQLSSQARLSGQGNYSLANQTYDFDFKLNQVNQKQIPFSISTIDDGVLDIDLQLSSLETIEIARQSGVFSAFPPYSQRLAYDFLNRNSDLVNVQGNYNQQSKSYSFSVDLFQAELVTSKISFVGNSVDGLRLVLDTKSGLLGGLELDQLPFNTTLTSTLKNYLQSPNTQTVQLSTTIDNSATNIFDVVISYTDLANSDLSLVLENGTIRSASMTAPASIASELVSNLNIALDNRYVNAVLQETVFKSNETVNLTYSPLTQGAYEVTLATATLEAIVSATGQAQSPLTIQLYVPSAVVRQIVAQEPSLRDFQNSVALIPFPEVLRIDGSYYPASQNYQLSSSIGHGSELLSEFALDNLQGANKFKLSIPLAYVPKDFAKQFNAPLAMETVISDWQQSSHNLNSSLGAEGTVAEGGFSLSGSVNHNGYQASSFSIEQRSDATNFVVDTPAQPLVGLSLTSLVEMDGLNGSELESFESELDDLLGESDRLSFSGTSNRLSTDYDVDVGLSSLTTASDVSATISRRASQFSVQIALEPTLVQKLIPIQFHNYIPDLLNVSLNWQNVQEINILAQSLDPSGTSLMSLQGVLRNRGELQFSTVLDATSIKKIKAVLVNSQASDYLALDQLTTVGLVGNINLRSTQYSINVGIDNTSNLQIQGDASKASFSGNLSSQLISLSNTPQDVQTELSKISQLPVQGSYDFAIGSYLLSTQLEESLSASLTNGRINLQMDGLFLERITVTETEASWIASFEDFDPTQLQSVDVFQSTMSNLGVDPALLNQTSLNGMLRNDASGWQGEVLVSTGRQDVSDIRIVGQADSLYIQTSLFQAGQRIDVSGPIYPNVALQVKGNFVDASGVARAQLNAELTNWQQPTLSGVLKTTAWHSGDIGRDMSIGGQEANIQASVTDLQNWQDTLKITAANPVLGTNVLEYQSSQLTGNWLLPVAIGEDAYSVSISTNASNINPLQLSKLQLQDLNLQAQITSELFNATLQDIVLSPDDLLTASIKVDPRSEAFIQMPLESLNDDSVSNIVGNLSYNLDTNRVEVSASSQVFGQNAALSVIRDLGQTSAVVNFPSFMPSTVPELTALSLPVNVRQYIGLDEAVNLNLNLDGAGLRFQSTGASVALNGQIVNDIIEVTVKHSDGTLTLTGLVAEPLTVKLDIPDPRKILTVNGIEQIDQLLSVDAIENIIKNPLVFDGTVDLVQGLDIAGIVRSPEQEVQIAYISQSSSNISKLTATTQLNNRTTTLIATKDSSSETISDEWQVDLNYGVLQVMGKIENQNDRVIWDLQSPQFDLQSVVGAFEIPLSINMAINLTGQLAKTDWLAVGTWSAHGETQDARLNLQGSYNGNAVNWQAGGKVSSRLFTDSLNANFDSPVNFEGQGSCVALACSLAQSKIEVEGITSGLTGTISPTLKLSGSLQHPILLALEPVQSATINFSQNESSGYDLKLAYRDLGADAKFNQQFVPQSVNVYGEVSYQDAFANQYRIETQDLTWTSVSGFSGSANGFVNQRVGQSWLTSSLGIKPIQSGLDISGPIYLNQEIIATSNIQAKLSGTTSFDLVGYFDVDAPLQLFDTRLPESLGSLQTRLDIVKDTESQSLLPYQLSGSITNFAGVSTTGSLLLDLQSGVRLNVETSSIEGVSVSAIANDSVWNLQADIEDVGLGADVLGLFPFAQADLLSITNILNEFKEAVVVNGSIALEQIWQQPLQVKENQLELRVGSSRFVGQVTNTDALSLTGQLDFNAQDLVASLPLTLSGPITVNSKGELKITSSLELNSDFVEPLLVSGNILPTAMYLQPLQSVIENNYLYMSGNQEQNLTVSGSLVANLKSVADSAFENASLQVSTIDETSLATSLLWQGLSLSTVLPNTFNELTQLTREELNVDLGGYIDNSNMQPISGRFKLQDSLLSVEDLSVENEFGRLNLKGNVTSSNLSELSQASSLEDVFTLIAGDLTGSVEPNWLRLSEQIVLPEGISASFSSLPISVKVQDSQINVSSSSSLGNIVFQTNRDLSNSILDLALNYNGFGINGRANYASNQISGNIEYSGFSLVYAEETIDVTGNAVLQPSGVVATGALYTLGQSASYQADVGWQSLAQLFEKQFATNSDITKQVLIYLPQAISQEDIRIDINNFSAKAFTPLQRVLPYFSPEIDGTVTIQSGVLVGEFESNLLTRERQLPIDIRLNGLLEERQLREATVSLAIDESPAKAAIDFQLQERVINGRVSLEYFPLQTLLGVVPQESQAFENLQAFEPFTAGFESGDNLSKLDLRVTGVGSAYIPFDQLSQSQVLLVAEQVIFDHESFVREDDFVMPVALRTQGQLTLRYQQEVLDIELAQFQSYRQSDQSLAGNWSASGQISEDRLGVNVSARAADLSPFILLSPTLAEQNILAKGDFNISAQGSLLEPVLFFSSNQFQADIGGGYVESEDISFIVENGEIKGRARLGVERPWQSDIEVELKGPVRLWPFDVDNIVADFSSPAFSTNFFGDFKAIRGSIQQQNGNWILNADGDLDNPFNISGILNPLSLNFSGDQLNLYSESFFVASSLSDVDLSLSYVAPNLLLRGDVVASQAELITSNTVRARRSDNPEFFERVLFDNIRLTAPRNMVFDESFLTAELATELFLEGSLAQPTLDGEAQLLEGELRYSGQSFILSEGSVRFDKLQGIYPTVSARAYANLDKSKLSSNPESYVIQPNTSQFQVFLDASGGYTFSPVEGRHILDLDAFLSSNAIVNPNNPRSLSEEDIVSLLTLRRIANDEIVGSDNVLGELVGANVVDAAAEIIEGAIGSALGEGVDVFTTGLSNFISDPSSANATSDPFGFGVRFSGYLDDSVFASYELGSFANSNYSLRNQFNLRYDDIFGLNRLGVNLSSSLDFASDSSDPLIELNMGWDYEINETISLSNSMELSNDDQELSFGIRFKW